MQLHNYIYNSLSRKTIVLLDQALYSGISFLLTFSLVRILSLSEFGVFSSLILRDEKKRLNKWAWAEKIIPTASDESI